MKNKPDSGFATILVVILGVVILGAAIFMFMRTRDKQASEAQQPTISETQQQTESKSKADTMIEEEKTLSEEVVAENIEKKNDVSRLGATVLEFMANNNGKVPSGWIAGELFSDDPNTTRHATNLKFYKTVSFAVGERAPLEKDIIRVVTGAKCGKSGDTLLGKTREIAIQYGGESIYKPFDAACQDI